MTEKTEPASEKKLEDAREKGQVPQSKDLSSAFAFTFALATLVLMTSSNSGHILSILKQAAGAASGSLATENILALAYRMAIEAIWVVGPVLLAGILGGLVGGWSHVGVLVSFEPLVPKPEKIDPVAGTKRIFSMRSLVELLKTVVKAIVIGWALYALIMSILPSMLRMSYSTVSGIGMTAWSSMLKLLGLSVVMFLVIGVIDFVIQKLLFLKDQKMGKDEVKREYKESEGDPLIKSERKAIAQEIAFSDPAPAVAGATALVVNPTHYAVAIRYCPEEYGLPVIVAKGVDEAAEHIRELAKEAAVPIIGIRCWRGPCLPRSSTPRCPRSCLNLLLLCCAGRRMYAISVMQQIIAKPVGRLVD